MATNIGTAAAFTTTNIKPASGEQIDSLWGHNIADNTGYVFYRPMMACCVTGVGLCYSPANVIGTDYATTYFQKLPEHRWLTGTWVGTTDSGGQITGHINGVQFFSYGGAGSEWKAGTKFDISGLVDGNWYAIGVKAGHASGNIASIYGLTLWAAGY